MSMSAATCRGSADSNLRGSPRPIVLQACSRRAPLRSRMGAAVTCAHQVTSTANGSHVRLTATSASRKAPPPSLLVCMQCGPLRVLHDRRRALVVSSRRAAYWPHSRPSPISLSLHDHHVAAPILLQLLPALLSPNAAVAQTSSMPPDLNSLPPSTSSSPQAAARPRRISITNADTFRHSPPSPRSPSLSSLQAAATINAGLHRSPSGASPARTNPGLERRRSSLMNNLSINDPAVPGPGELQQSSGSTHSSPRFGRRSLVLNTADPHHQRQPSLGELHQELENEQEAQVNRLLQMIRIQQDQIAQIQRSTQNPQEPSPTSTEQTRFPTPPSTLLTPGGTNVTEQSSPRSASISSGFPHAHGPFHRPHSLSRQSSARLSNAGTNSRGNSPALRPASGSLGPLTEDFLLGGTRDDSAFYQAETQMLTRENQMLKQRIRDLGECPYIII